MPYFAIFCHIMPEHWYVCSMCSASATMRSILFCALNTEIQCILNDMKVIYNFCAQIFWHSICAIHVTCIWGVNRESTQIHEQLINSQAIIIWSSNQCNEYSLNKLLNNRHSQSHRQTQHAFSVWNRLIIKYSLKIWFTCLGVDVCLYV